MQDTFKRAHLEYLFAGTVLIGSVIFLTVTPAPKGRYYDCSISEISPDYPVEVKNECRKVRAEKFSKDLQKPK
jgi:hypothetical protein